MKNKLVHRDTDNEKKEQDHNLEASRLIELANISDDTGAAAAIAFFERSDNADKALILTEAIERAANATGAQC